MHRGRKLKQKASTYLGEISRTSLLQILAQPRLAPRCILAAPLPAPPLSLTLMAGRMEVESPQHTRVSTRHTPEHMRCFARVTGCGPSKLRELTLKFPSHEDLEQASEADFRKVPKRLVQHWLQSSSWSRAVQPARIIGMASYVPRGRGVANGNSLPHADSLCVARMRANLGS